MSTVQLHLPGMDARAAVPLPIENRIPVLDVVRGFALLGILIMNMPGFSTSYFAEADGAHLWPGRIDQLAEQIRDLLFAGKFNSMFSLLFGIGFTIQFARMQEQDPASATRRYLRRLLALFAIGVVHAMVFWTGDVLHIYAVLGILLVLPLRRASDRTLLLLMLLCLSYPLVSGLVRLLVSTPETTAELVAKAKDMEASNNVAYGHGTFPQAAAEHAREMIAFYTNPWWLWGALGFWVQMALTMLLGLLAGRRRWAQRIPELMPQVRRIHRWTLVVGLLAGATFTVIFEVQRAPGPTPLKVLGGVAYWVCRLSMMLFYVLAIVRLMQRPEWARRLEPLGATGRMPLTNYLLETAICTAIFYGWGLGLWGKVGPAAGLALSFAIYFAVLVPWSRWWLARHDRGPMEALWSRFTYGAPRSSALAAPGPGLR
jgi:uncharacterized protein